MFETSSFKVRSKLFCVNAVSFQEFLLSEWERLQSLCIIGKYLGFRYNSSGEFAEVVQEVSPESEGLVPLSLGYFFESSDLSLRRNVVFEDAQQVRFLRSGHVLQDLDVESGVILEVVLDLLDGVIDDEVEDSLFL